MYGHGWEGKDRDRDRDRDNEKGGAGLPSEAARDESIASDTPSSFSSSSSSSRFITSTLEV